jgi:hypothetical protein
LGAWRRLFYTISRQIPFVVQQICAELPAKSAFSVVANYESAEANPGTAVGGKCACNTVRVGERRNEPGSSPGEPLGAPRDGYGELEPVSPELALVDTVLGERARMLLPEPRERPRPVWTEEESARPMPVDTSLPETAPSRVRKRNRWRRTVALALLLFIAGAASGGLLGRKNDRSPQTPLQAQAKLSTIHVPTGAERAGGETGVDGTRSAARAQTNRPRPSTATGTRFRRAPAATWARNVLGVTVGIDRRGVKLAWQRPTTSSQVVVVRKLVSRGNSVIVFKGRATSFRDVSARPCTAYRYVIINYDRRGHPSTGVPTAVVTQGCGRKRSSRSSA